MTMVEVTPFPTARRGILGWVVVPTDSPPAIVEEPVTLLEAEFTYPDEVMLPDEEALVTSALPAARLP
jgi:hypothetical protein